ncbi:MAG: cupin domain-containing protein [Bacteroidetes bacterium]|nr:MAG: cupin domain-containing protein [Bacteroidota bacterium]
MDSRKQKEMEKLVKLLDLQPHPEGGFYRETYRSEEMIRGGKRSILTSIYFLLTSESISHFHRIKSDEHWYYHGGSPLIVHTLDMMGHHQHIVGNDIEAGYYPYFMVPKDTIFGSTVMDADGFSLVSCAVAPGFDFSDFELMNKEDLASSYPDQLEIIEKLCIS